MDQDCKKTKELPPESKLNLPLLHNRLHHVFRASFAAIDIAESLIILDADKPITEAKKILCEQNREVAGVSDRGQVIGYVEKSRLKTGCCGDYIQKLDSACVLDFRASYQDVIEVLSRSENCFVRFLEQIAGIIHKRDMMKPSVRMWLFGLITILEMNLSKSLERTYPANSWQTELPKGRLEKAMALLSERRKRGQELELKDCLYFADKASILAKNPSIRERWGVKNRSEAKQLISKFESLRNSLAHTHDIVAYDWNAIVVISRRLNEILSRF